MSNQRGGTPVSKYSMVERSDGSSEVDDTKYSIGDEGEVITDVLFCEECYDERSADERRQSGVGW